MNNQLRINVNKQDAYRFFPILLGVYLLINAVLSLFFIEGITEGNTAMYYIVAGASTLSLGLVSFAYCKIAKVDFLAGAKLKTFPKWYTLVFAVLCGLSLIAVMLPVNNWFLEFLVKCGLPEPSVDIPLTNDFWGIVCAVIFVCILPAFCEEVAFRGIVGSGLTNSAVKGKLVLMLLFSGFLFMIFHMN
ncbi:MAG: CPBP family glutamic-type intramembrane protease, partial [Clostridia bacterium]